MPAAQAFLQGSRIKQAGLLGNRRLDILERQGNQRTDIQQQEVTRRTQNDKLKNRIETIGSLSATVTDRDLPDSQRLIAANEFNRLSGNPIVFTDITEIDKVEKIFKKQNNLKKRLDKGEITDQFFIDALRGLDTELKLSLGKEDAFKEPLQAAENIAQRDFDNDVAEVARIFGNRLQGGQINTEDAASFAKIKTKFGNNPERMKALLRDAETLIQGRISTQAKDTKGQTQPFDISSLNRPLNAQVQQQAVRGQQPLPQQAQQGQQIPQGQQQPARRQLQQRQQPARQATIQQGTVPGTSIKRVAPILTRAKILNSTGLFAGIRRLINNTLGAAISVDLAKKTSAGKADILSFNQFVKSALLVDGRKNVFELKEIDTFLVDPRTPFTSNDTQVRRMAGLRKTLESRRESMIAILGRGSIGGKKEFEDTVSNINSIDSILGVLPSVLELLPKEATLDQLNKLTNEQIKGFDKAILDLLPPEVVIEMNRRIL